MRGTLINNFCHVFRGVLLLRASLRYAVVCLATPLRAFNVVVGGFNERRKFVWTKVHADLVGNYCLLSESKLTESNTSLAIQHFVSDSSYCMRWRLCTRTHRNRSHSSTKFFLIISQITKFTKILCHEKLSYTVVLVHVLDRLSDDFYLRVVGV